jgi:hypothetical protein
VLVVRAQRPIVRRIPARTGWISHGAHRCRRATCGRRGVRRRPPQSASLDSLPAELSDFAKVHRYRSATRSVLSKANVDAHAVESGVPPAARPADLPARPREIPRF